MGSRILYLEDDPAQREALEQLLRLEGYRPDAVASVEEARQRLEAGRYDALLLDFFLPDGTALDVLEAADLPARKVVVVTAHPSPELPVKVALLGKPVALDELWRALHRAVRGGEEPALGAM